MATSFLEYLQFQGKSNISDATPEDIALYLESCLPPLQMGWNGKPHRPSTSMVYQAYRLLVQCFGKPLHFHPSQMPLSVTEMAEAIAEDRVIHICSIHGDFASGDVRFHLVKSTNALTDTTCNEADILLFQRPCRLTDDIVQYLNDNPWERAWDMRKGLGL